MTQIGKPLNKATVAETSGLATNMSNIITQKAIDDSYLSQQAQELAAKGEQMENSIATNMSKAKTQELVDADGERDALISSLKLFLRANIQWKREGLSNKAETIYSIIKTHGLAMANENYEEQSTLLASLLDELAKPENDSIIEELGLSELVSALNQSEQVFKELYRESVSIEAGKGTIISASTIKKEVFQLQKQTIEYLNVMQMANSDKYASVSSEVAELVRILNQKIKNRYKN